MGVGWDAFTYNFGWRLTRLFSTPFTDGSTDPDVLEEVLGKNLEQTVDFYVYNTETDTVRTATLMPNTKWGGRGCLGAEIGHGYLHGLPQKCCKTNGGCAGHAHMHD